MIPAPASRLPPPPPAHASPAQLCHPEVPRRISSPPPRRGPPTRPGRLSTRLAPPTSRPPCGRNHHPSVAMRRGRTATTGRASDKSVHARLYSWGRKARSTRAISRVSFRHANSCSHMRSTRPRVSIWPTSSRLFVRAVAGVNELCAAFSVDCENCEEKILIRGPTTQVRILPLKAIDPHDEISSHNVPGRRRSVITRSVWIRNDCRAHRRLNRPAIRRPPRCIPQPSLRPRSLGHRP